MATIPRNLKRPQQPVAPPTPTYTLEQMAAFGWLSQMPIDSAVPVPRFPSPRIPAGEDPRIPRKDETP